MEKDNTSHDFLNKENISFNLKEFISKYFRFWYLFFISVTIALSFAFLYLKFTHKQYITTAKVKILSEEESSSLPSLSDFTMSGGSKVSLENEISIFTSYRLLREVVLKEGLTQTFYSVGDVNYTELDKVPFKISLKKPVDSLRFFEYKITFDIDKFFISNEISGDKYSFGSNIKTTKKSKHNLPFEIIFNNDFELKDRKPIVIQFKSVLKATLALQKKVSITPIGKDTDLISLSIKGTLKNKSERIINSLIEVYNNDGVHDKQMVDKRTIDFIDERFETLTKELSDIEIEKKDFKQENKMFDIKSNLELGLNKQTKTEEELFQLEQQMLVSKMLEETLNKDTLSILPSDIGLGNTTVNNLINIYNEKVFEMNKLLNSGGSNNPTVKLLSESLLGLKNNLNLSLSEYIKQLGKRKINLINRNRNIISEVSNLPLKEKLYREIERKQKIKESLFLLLLEKREIASIEYAVTEPVIKVVDYALSSINPISPNVKSTYLQAFFLGFFLPFLFLYIKFSLNTKIQNSSDVEIIAQGTPILSSIPFIKDVDKVDTNSKDDRSILRESFRTLLTNLNFIIPETEKGQAKTLLVTSSIKGEGKTLVSYNLAVELANYNNKVILVGADLRNPQLHKNQGVENVKQGLSSYLHRPELDFSDLDTFQDHEKTNLDILFAGAIPPNPTSLLSSKRFEDLLDHLKQNYDYIVIDTAPTLLVSDTLIFGRLADTTIYVTRANHTEKNIVEYSKRLIDENKLNNVGYVVNGVEAKKGYGYGYGYNYEYAYTYGYTYDDDKEAKKKWFNFRRK